MRTAFKLPLAAGFVACVLLLLAMVPKTAWADHIKGPYLVSEETSPYASYAHDVLTVKGDITITGMSGTNDPKTIDVESETTPITITIRCPQEVVVDNSVGDYISLTSSSGSSITIGNSKELNLGGSIKATITGVISNSIFVNGASTLIVAPGSVFHNIHINDDAATLDYSLLSSDATAKFNDGLTSGASFSIVVPLGTDTIGDLFENGVMPTTYNGGAYDVFTPTDSTPLLIGTVAAGDTRGVIVYSLIHEVTFVDWTGTALGSQKVNHGFAAVAPIQVPEREGYAFTGWDKAFDSVTEDMTVAAAYSLNPANPHGAFMGGDVFAKGSKTDLTYKVEKDYALYDYAEVDGARAGASQVEVGEGSTIAMLKASYLNTLSTGNHTVKVVFSDGSFSEGAFRVADAAALADDPNPQKLAAAGDATQYACLVLLGVLAFGGLMVARRRTG